MFTCVLQIFHGFQKFFFIILANQLFSLLCHSKITMYTVFVFLDISIGPLFLSFPTSHDFSTYRTRTKFCGLNDHLKISNYVCGSLFLWGVNFCGCNLYFVLKDAIKYCARACILKLIFQWFLAPSMPLKRDISTQNLPWLSSTDLRLNTEKNKLESVVNMCKDITDRVTWSR